MTNEATERAFTEGPSEEPIRETLPETEFSEELPSLVDFAGEPGGAWDKGWYRAEVIEGYATGKGTTFLTKDELSKGGDSRNVTFCFRVFNKAGQERTIFDQQNYRVTDFTPERLAQIKEGREANRGVKGKWTQGYQPGDLQRSSLAIATLGQFEKALGFRFKRGPNGALLPGVFIGQKVDVYLGINKEGYNDITEYAAAGSKEKRYQ
jgi:hypothetical protein